MLNSINLIGRLVSDPELRKTNSDVSFATFTLAVDNPVKESDGTRGTCFLDCRIFREQAENLVKFTRKGHKVGVTGAIAQRNFVRNDGSKGRAYEVYVDSVEYLEPKPVDEVQQAEQEEAEIVQEPKFDPMTGKPLKPAKK